MSCYSHRFGVVLRVEMLNTAGLDSQKGSRAAADQREDNCYTRLVVEMVAERNLM